MTNHPLLHIRTEKLEYSRWSCRYDSLLTGFLLHDPFELRDLVLLGCLCYAVGIGFSHDRYNLPAVVLDRSYRSFLR